MFRRKKTSLRPPLSPFAQPPEMDNDKRVLDFADRLRGDDSSGVEPLKSKPVAESEEEPARDTVASMLRSLAEFALPTKDISKDEFAVRCEELAVAVLVKNVIDDNTGEPRKPEKIYRDVKQLVREQRRVESKEYNKHRESAHIIVTDLVTSLRRSLEKRENYDHEIVQMLVEMEAVVETGDLRQIKRVSSKTAGHIKDIIAVQREQDKRQLGELSDQLRDMRKELKETQAQMQRDPLTKVLNRGAFDEAFEKTVELSHVSAMELTLFMLDLDHFKKVNDTYGHQAGDLVLQTVAKQLIRCFPRKDDMVVRYGGEEFVILCRNTGAEHAAMLGERLRSGVEALGIELDETTINQTVSVGFAVLKRKESAKRFLKRADKALYAAKRLGRNRVEPLR